MLNLSRNRPNEMALVDQHGNTVGVILSNEQPPPPFQVPQNDTGNIHLKYPVPCSKLSNVTIEWLKENFMENQFNSLPRNIIFEEYTSFCYRIDMRPFNQAVFGKIVRACFPNLTTRRLGMRGQSRYHYAGLATKPTSCYVERFRSIQEQQNAVRAVGVNRKKKPGKKSSLSSILRSHPADTKRNTKQRTCGGPAQLESLLISTSAYPFTEDIDSRFRWPVEILDEFLNFYRDYNHQFLSYIISMDFDKTLAHLRSFSSFVPYNCRALLETTEVCYILNLCDDVMFGRATATLLPNCFATLSTEFNVSIRKYSKTLPVWIGDACNHDSNINPSVYESRVNSARSWADYVQRVTTLCHVTKEARKTLADPGIVVQLLRDLQGLSMDDTAEQCTYAASYEFSADPKKVAEKTFHDKKKAKELVCEFAKLLEKMVSVEKFAALLEKIINNHAGLLPEPQYDSPDYCFDVITPQTRIFMMKWSMFGSKMLTEITLRSSESVGPFHLVMLLFGDYVNHIICIHQERANRLKRMRDVIDKDSPYLYSHPIQAKTQMRAFSAFTPVSTASVIPVHHPASGPSYPVHVKEPPKTPMTAYHHPPQQPHPPSSYFGGYMPPTANQGPPYMPPQYHQETPMCHTSMGNSAFASYYHQPPMPIHHHSVPPPNPYQHVPPRFVSPNLAPQSPLPDLAHCTPDQTSYYLLPNAKTQ